MERTQKAALGSVGIGLVVLGLKFAAYWLTGSIALYSDALESTINVVAAGAAFVALRVSAHRLTPITLTATIKQNIFRRSSKGAGGSGGLFDLPRRLSWLSCAQVARSTRCRSRDQCRSEFHQWVWAWLLLSWGRRWQSPALAADGRHVMADVLTSAGVIIGVALVSVTGWLVLDSIVAMLVGVNILWSGYAMVREGTGGLMDEAPPPEIVARIKELIGQHAAGAIEAHDVRTRHAGRITFVEFHLVVPGDIRVAEAHEICDRIEAALKTDMNGEALITIHVEPEVQS